jgi:hypothetical protein
MTKARDIANLLSTANGKIAGSNLDVSFENISDTGTEGTKVASGTTAQRGSTQGQLRFNTTSGLAEYYTGTGFKVIDAPPAVSSLDVTEVDSQAGGNQTIVITGTGFASGATVTFVGNSGTDFNASTVTVNSETQITAVAPKASFLNAQEPYGVKVTNASGLANTLATQINVDTSPSWQTASGSLGSILEDATGNHFTVSATDADSDTVAYSLQSGSLAGLSLNSSTGVISGNPTDVSSDTTNSFTLRATANGKTADRAFSYITQNDTLGNGLIAYYADAYLTDSSGNNHTGVKYGSGTVSQSTDSGTPLGSRTVTSFPDSDGYIHLPTATIITGTNDRTITCWVKPNASLDDNDYIFGFGFCSSGSKGTFNARCGSNKMGFMGCGADYDNQGNVIYSTGTWVRIFYTMSGETVSAYYLDGSGNRVSNWSTTLSGISTSNASGATASIGAHASSPGSGDIGGCNATLADFRIYNRVLTEAEMERLYNF